MFLRTKGASITCRTATCAFSCVGEKALDLESLVCLSCKLKYPLPTLPETPCCIFLFLCVEQCAKECTYTYDASLTKCNQQVSDKAKNTYGANLDACANTASGIMDDCMVSYIQIRPCLYIRACLV